MFPYDNTEDTTTVTSYSTSVSELTKKEDEREISIANLIRERDALQESLKAYQIESSNMKRDLDLANKKNRELINQVNKYLEEEDNAKMAFAALDTTTAKIRELLVENKSLKRQLADMYRWYADLLMSNADQLTETDARLKTIQPMIDRVNAYYKNKNNDVATTHDTTSNPMDADTVVTTSN